MSDQENKPVEEKNQEKPEQQENAVANEEAAESTEKATPEQQPKEMRAVVLSSFGGLKSVKVLKKPEPTVSEGEILIRVKAW